MHIRRNHFINLLSFFVAQCLLSFFTTIFSCNVRHDTFLKTHPTISYLIQRNTKGSIDDVTSLSNITRCKDHIKHVHLNPINVMITVINFSNSNYTNVNETFPLKTIQRYAKFHGYLFQGGTMSLIFINIMYFFSGRSIYRC